MSDDERMEDRQIVLLGDDGIFYTCKLGAWIIEQQAHSTPKRILAILESSVVCESLAGKRSRVARRNLGRYRVEVIHGYIQTIRGMCSDELPYGAIDDALAGLVDMAKDLEAQLARYKEAFRRLCAGCSQEDDWLKDPVKLEAAILEDVDATNERTER